VVESEKTAASARGYYRISDFAIVLLNRLPCSSIRLGYGTINPDSFTFYLAGSTEKT